MPRRRASLRADVQRNRGGRRTRGLPVLAGPTWRFGAGEGSKGWETGPLTVGPNQQSIVFQRRSEVGIMEQSTATGWSDSCRAGFVPRWDTAPFHGAREIRARPLHWGPRPVSGPVLPAHCQHDGVYVPLAFAAVAKTAL